MELSPLTAISPIDGRYRKQLENLDEYFSEFALIRARVRVEVEYFLFLSEKKFFSIDTKTKSHLKKVAAGFSLRGCSKRSKDIENTTNHDVKAVEYFLKEKLDNPGAGDIEEWIHFGLTSQDINNTAIPMLWKDAVEKQYLPLLKG